MRMRRNLRPKKGRQKNEEGKTIFLSPIVLSLVWIPGRKIFGENWIMEDNATVEQFIALRNQGHAPQAPGGWRTPRRYRVFRSVGRRASVLECGCPLPLFEFGVYRFADSPPRRFAGSPVPRLAPCPVACVPWSMDCGGKGVKGARHRFGPEVSRLSKCLFPTKASSSFAPP